MSDYNLRFRTAFKSLGISKEQFVKDFNSYSELQVPTLSQSRLSLILSGKTFVPIELVDYLCTGDEGYNMNYKYFTGESDSMFPLKERIEDVKEDTISLWEKFKNLFNFSIFNPGM